ncbi:hypothetical protein QQS21_000086 [Conoideocrella luteorostrata]|uniref:BZIP domain-containing protein n=1 Tax=Conoideocrella luteorostrata TaxID=1105319 RepID=A0AAJ0CZN6_9HYPO|nr:hypothetical protein QQS21_000086 [Conoideocrella luteorostrata]
MAMSALEEYPDIGTWNDLPFGYMMPFDSNDSELLNIPQSHGFFIPQIPAEALVPPCPHPTDTRGDYQDWCSSSCVDGKPSPDANDMTLRFYHARAESSPLYLPPSEEKLTAQPQSNASPPRPSDVVSGSKSTVPKTCSRPRSRTVNRGLKSNGDNKQCNDLLERNRAAAIKFRKKSKESAQKLELATGDLERKHDDLRAEYCRLSAEVLQLKCDLMDHVVCNDKTIDAWLKKEAKNFTETLMLKCHPSHNISPTSHFSTASSASPATTEGLGPFSPCSPILGDE